MTESESGESKRGEDKPGESGPGWLFSDSFLGALVVLLTIATAFAAYQGALTGIEGDDLDFAAQRAMVLATGSYLSGNTEFLEDLQTYDSYRLFAGTDDQEAARYLDRASEALRAGLERPGGPFDEAYEEVRYGDAVELIEEAQRLEEQANAADDKARIFELSGLIFAIGLAATAWAALVGSGRRIKFVFLLLALVSLVTGLVVIIQVVSV